MKKQNKQEETHIYRQQNGGYQRGNGVGEGEVGKAGQKMVMEENQTSGGECAVQYTHVKL